MRPVLTPASPPAAAAPVAPRRVQIFLDVWHPMMSGVYRTFRTLVDELRALGREVSVVAPADFPTVPCPTYGQLRLGLCRPSDAAARMERFAPDAVHVATEGPVGLAARRHCVRTGTPFTTSYTTRLPEYVHARFRVPTALTYRLLRWFHAPSSGVMAATDRLCRELADRGFPRPVRWRRGVDLALFRPRDKDPAPGPRPLLLCAGRVAVEKNLEAFLDLDVPGTKMVVGDGPQLPSLRRRYPHAHFTGLLRGEALARAYASADVLVFPSRTDTFGLVMLEALASGVPVAAFPVAGPLDVLGSSGAGALDRDLARAVERALAIDPAVCRAHARRFSWRDVARSFLSLLRPCRAPAARLPQGG